MRTTGARQYLCTAIGLREMRISIVLAPTRWRLMVQLLYCHELTGDIQRNFSMLLAWSLEAKLRNDAFVGYKGAYGG